MKFKISLFLLSAMALTGCYDDKGNYSYTTEEEITVTFPEQINAMEGTEYISFDPLVESNIAGELTDANENYEFGCKIRFDNYDEKGKKQSWYDIDSLRTKAINFRAKFPASSYVIWYTVTNKEKNITHSFTSSVNIINSTSEGWLIVSNNGADKRGRIDMISRDSKGDEILYPNIHNDKTPEFRDVRQIFVNVTMLSNMLHSIWMCCGNGTWKLDAGNLQTDESYNIKLTHFFDLNAPGDVVWWYPVRYGRVEGPMSQVAITSEGNCYGTIQWVGGTGFEYPLNTDRADRQPTYKVAPMCAASEVRPGNTNLCLFYDITNKRFVGFAFTDSYGDSEYLHPLVHNTDDGPEKFNYTTGMDFVHMEGTRFSDGVVYTVLQDNAGKRHIFGIHTGFDKFTQESYYTDITVPEFHTAIDYAFNSRYQYVCFAEGNKVFCYDYFNKVVTDVLTLPDGEHATMVKFPLYHLWDLSRLSNKTEEFLEKQYQLAVGSSKGGADSGIVRFYDIDPSGKLTLMTEYTGLGEEPVDIAYRERFN